MSGPRWVFMTVKRFLSTVGKLICLMKQNIIKFTPHNFLYLRETNEICYCQCLRTLSFIAGETGHEQLVAQQEKKLI